ncbi:hypothetical protein ACFPID_10035 [Bifidobacterium leontopitheci]
MPVWVIRRGPITTLRGDVGVLFARISGHSNINEYAKRLDSNVFTDSAFRGNAEFAKIKHTHLAIKRLRSGRRPQFDLYREGEAMKLSARTSSWTFDLCGEGETPRTGGRATAPEQQPPKRAIGRQAHANPPTRATLCHSGYLPAVTFIRSARPSPALSPALPFVTAGRYPL